jgi:hypothetical protein
VLGKIGRKVKTCSKMCTHVCKCKNDTCWNYSRKGGGDEGEGLKKYIMYDIFATL